MKPIYHFLHIGKTGGCALIAALEPYKGKNGGPLRLHEHPTTLLNIPRDEYYFVNVRHPESRFLSAFYYVMRHHAPREVVPVPWNKQEKEFYRIFQTPRDALEALSSTNRNTREIAENGLNHAWHMRDKQIRWFKSMAVLKERQDQLFHVNFNNTYEADFKRLLEKLELPSDIELPKDERIANIGKKESDDKQLSERARRNLQKWYHEDYELYNYLLELKEKGTI